MINNDNNFHNQTKYELLDFEIDFEIFFPKLQLTICKYFHMVQGPSI